MYYELVVLSLLMRMPMHGYLIMKITNDQIGPWAKVSSGTLSTVLRKLEGAGLIATVPQGRVTPNERARTFVITEDGRRRFHQLMMDMSTGLGDYQRLFHHKLIYFDLLKPAERLLLIDHYMNYCQVTILHLQTEMASLVYELADQPSPVFLQNILRVTRHIEQQWQDEYAWIKEIRENEAMENT